MLHKKTLFFSLFFSVFTYIYADNQIYTGPSYRTNKSMGFLTKIYHGIVPEKIDTLCTLLMAGSIVSSAIIYGNVSAIKTFIKNKGLS